MMARAAAGDNGQMAGRMRLSEVVTLERDDAVAILTLNRPDRLNACTAGMIEALRAHFDAIARDAGLRAAVLTGDGRGFCAGQDLTERAATPGAARVDLGDSLDSRFNPLVRQMRALPKPIVVAVNGVAAGVGANLALHGDIVLAAKSARFLQAFVKIGLMPDGGGTWTLPRLVGEARAKALAMLAEPLPAEQAAAWGLIWRAVEDAELMGEARALAHRLAGQSAPALAAIKSSIQASATNSLDAQLDLERDGQRALGQGEDFVEGVAAFLQKRAPIFRRG